VIRTTSSLKGVNGLDECLRQTWRIYFTSRSDVLTDAQPTVTE